MRRTNTWTYFVSLICAAALTLLLLPACGGSSSEGCNTPAAQIEGLEDVCDIEEDVEELLADEDGVEDEIQEDTGLEEENIEALEEGLSLEDETAEEDA